MSTEIELSQGKKAIVDNEDYERLSQRRWYASNEHGRFYAKTCVKGSGSKIRMHRFIMGVTDPNTLVDHKNHNTLDNRKSNLRICTTAENTRNVQSHKGGTSKYLGVSFDKANNKWMSQIYHNKKQIKIGRYKDEKEAALMYDIKAKELHKEFANLNFK